MAGSTHEDTRTLSNGSVVPVWVLTNPTSDRRFFLTNADGLFVAYDAVVLAMEKRQSSFWQASGSYTYSRARGRQVLSNGGADDPQFSTIASPS